MAEFKDIKSLARVHTESAVRTLAGIMNQPNEAAPSRVAAACALLDRGWGRPAQTITGMVQHDITSEDLEARLRQLSKLIGIEARTIDAIRGETASDSPESASNIYSVQ